MVDYARTRIGPGGDLTLKTAIAGTVSASAPFTTPWRVIFLADRAADLLNRQYLIENLNPPNRIADPSWIKPGKAMRVTCSDEACARSYIDFGVRMGLQYLHWDAGWYGPERDAGSDPTRAVWPIDIAEYIRDAKARGLGLFLYVNQMALTRRLDEMLPLYRSWGISGIKYGFVDVGPQPATLWLHEAVRKTAAHNMMVDIHDEYVPTGFSRTYPNLLTQEGIGGDEIFPSPEQTLTFLFGRMLAGAADHTVCYFDGRVTGSAGWTRAYQLAKPIVFYSPLQYLFWYDTPARYGDQPELELWREMPTVWDDSRALQGDIGSHIVMARRSGSEWYLGSMTAAARTLQIPLSFLDGDKWYMAQVFVNGNTSAQVRIARYLVHAGFSLKAILPRAGGQSVRLTPATAQEIQAYRGRKPAGWQDDIAVHPDTDPSSLASAWTRNVFAAGFKAEGSGGGTVRLFLPPGTSAWQVRSIRGDRVAAGRGDGSILLAGLRPGMHHAMADTPGGRIVFRFVVSR
jgi:alpha-glucosidase